MEEIGGYFELGGFPNDIYHKKAIAINTARNCLIYVIKSRKLKKIYVPYYLCDSVDKASDYCEIEYYKVDHNFLPDFERELEDNAYVYIVNYFGLLSNNKIIELMLKYKNIIIDNVQDFFQEPVNEIDTIYSCRKYFGVPDGAYLYTDNILNEELEEEFSKDRFKHILGRLENSASEYYEEYTKSEALLGKLPLRKMSKTTSLILGGIDYHKIKKIRTENFKHLNDKLKDVNNLKFENVEGAFAYPFYAKNATDLRKILIENKVYVPILWPNVIKQSQDKLAYDYALNILPLPCDQRYGVKEMDKIIKIVKENC